jgi:hypothetical protein
VNGEPNWRGVQLDETAFPIMLAWQLHESGALQLFDPYPMVLKAAGFLIEHGPVTPQERWEENSGYSPSTLAALISALVCAGEFAKLKNHGSTARYFLDYADFIESNLDTWTVTTEGVRPIRADTQRNYHFAINRHFNDWLDKPIALITEDLAEQRHHELTVSPNRLGTSGHGRANNALNNKTSRVFFKEFYGIPSCHRRRHQQELIFDV